MNVVDDSSRNCWIRRDLGDQIPSYFPLSSDWTDVLF